MAPELFQRIEYTEKCDVYSFALIVYWIVSGSEPFAEIPRSDIPKYVLSGERPQLSKVETRIKHLISACWSQEFEDRPSFAKIIDEIDKLGYHGDKGMCAFQ
jgi:mitogen-activated protein kinase kinase kinase 7